MYDELASKYHLIFEDWHASIARQAGLLGPILERELPGARLRILDCACGIGTQTLGLASRGHKLTASDTSAGAVKRARAEAASLGLEITFRVADMRDPAGPADPPFDAVIALDNALPHLPDETAIAEATSAIASKLRPGGIFLASIRDYDRILAERPYVQGPTFYRDGVRRRIVHQVWDWIDDRTYVLHLYITRKTETGWEADHFVSQYRSVRRDELTAILTCSRFREIRWLMPEETGFYQPIVIALSPAASPSSG